VRLADARQEEPEINLEHYFAAGRLDAVAAAIRAAAAA
jgi:hypothetical protein